MTRSLLTASLALALLGCLETGQEATTVELSVAGTDTSGPIEGRGGVPITLERADVAFGPLYLCAGFTAGTLCDEALAEWPDAVVVDTLSSEPSRVGTMAALSGVTHSYMYDYGIVSRLTTPGMPLVTPAAEELGRASVVVEGRAEIQGQVVPFLLAIRIEQMEEVEQGVPVVRSGESDGIDAEISPAGRSQLLVRFDPSSWLTQADFSTLVEDAACEVGDELRCAGAVEQRCDADGSTLEVRDCGAIGQVCVREMGCVERVEVPQNGQIARSLRAAVEAGRRASFDFSIGP